MRSDFSLNNTTKSFDIFPPDWGMLRSVQIFLQTTTLNALPFFPLIGGCSEVSRCVQIFFKHSILILDAFRFFFEHSILI